MRPLVVPLLLLGACAAEPADTPLAPTTPLVDMAVGTVIDRQGFRDRDGDGIADVFESRIVSPKARDVRFAVDDRGDQRIHVSLAPCPPVDGPDGDVCGFGTNGDGRVSLIDVARAASPGQYYKGWFEGRTVDSNNNGSGVCEEDAKDAPGREQFRTQLKIWFKDPADEIVGSCYCNVCPREDGNVTYAKCNTSQWSIRTTLSDDGACLAPPGTTEVQFAVIGLARDRQPDRDGALRGPEATGTAVFHHYTFARCGQDGFCDAPDVVAATRWY